MIGTRTFFLASFAAAALIACGDDSGSATSSGTGGNGGNDPTGSGGNGTTSSAVTSSASSTSASSTSASSTAATTTSSTGGEGGNGTGGNGTGGAGTGGSGEGGSIFTSCDVPVEVFADPDVNACGNDFCCDQMTVCADDPSLCFDLDTGTFALDLPDGAALYECSYLAGCLGAPVCDSGIGFGANPTPETLEFAYCLDQNCCEEMNACSDFGADTQGCIDCLLGDAANYDLCEAVNTCSTDNCGGGLIFVPVCDSGLGTSNPSVGECLDANCCAEYTACTGGDPDDDVAIQACLDCFEAGGGALCDDALACEAASCSTLVCDSGISFSDVDTAACLTENCCTEYTACAGGDPDDEAAIQACIDCFVAEGGALCDEAIACTDTFCGGGAGGGGGVGGGM